MDNIDVVFRVGLVVFTAIGGGLGIAALVSLIRAPYHNNK